MTNYYYIIASLPAITRDWKFGDRTAEGLIGEIKGLSTPRDLAAISFIESGFKDDNLDIDFYRKALSFKNPFIREYYTFDLNVRNAKARYLNRALGREEDRDVLRMDGDEDRTASFEEAARLEAILNDTITQTSSYEKGMIQNILKALKKVVVSLQSYLFSDIDFQSMKRPHATLEAFVRLLSLQFHIEMHINAKQSLEKAKQDPTDASWIEKQYSNPLIGSIPTSMLELCTILRREILPLNETGGSEPIHSSIGCYCLSLLHLLLVHSTKCASLLLFDEQV